MPSDDLERRRRDELDRPPMAWLPIVVIGGLALFGAWSLFTFVVATIGTLVKLTIVGGIVALVIWILVKGYQGPPDD
ncbi:MAG: hypothetical protein KDB10_03905 [Acidimicrobiales bacterium]|nr:hypothetical protein [Acidimicrobiales bacterium]MCB9373894.1 hypothetical protein [Microthrixaceae bacterium]